MDQYMKKKNMLIAEKERRGDMLFNFEAFISLVTAAITAANLTD